MAKAKKKTKKTRKSNSSKKGKSAKKAKVSKKPRIPKKRKSPGKATASLESRVGIAVTFTSDPTGGMAMKVNGNKLSSLPSTLTLAGGTHLLEWTFAGPSGAKYSVIVAGAQSPTNPIDDEIRDGENSASGTFNVQV
jgi:hypothetical protein